jgi:cysteine-S-conjugate beta-lyase
MRYDFDEEIERRGTSCVKWEFVKQGNHLVYGDRADPGLGPERLLPLWVADMDFRCPPEIVRAVVERAEQGIYGYSYPCDSYYEAVIRWMAGRYGRRVERDWIVLTPGVVPALHMLVQNLVEPGEKVLVQRPVYYPFFGAIETNGAEVVSSSLVLSGGRYQMDFDDLARTAADPAVKMAILCSPHNPVGRVWTGEELLRFGEICLANDVLVVSDEIHCDLIHGGHTFTSFAAVSEAFEQKSIVCTAASKSFNLAGLKSSNIIVPDPALRAKLEQAVERNALGGANPFGLVAVEAAYNFGQEWLAAAMAYVEDNYRYMEAYLARHLPQLQIIPPEGTYLVWVDFRALGLSPELRKELLMEQARVYLDEGELFGPEGEGFERFNLACPRSILEEALERIRLAVESLS